MTAINEMLLLKREMESLFHYVHRMRQEIAAIRKPADSEHQIESMGDQLDAIVAATEHATNTIMGAVEKNDELLAQLRNGLKDADKIALIDQMTDNGVSIIEACSFQDITGQRVGKVIKSVAYVEDRVNALASIWGKAELDRVEIKGSEKSSDEKLLNGPQLQGKGISQDEIDKLFG